MSSQEDREYFKECSKRYERKSKNEKNAKIQTNLSALKKCGKVWEFGHEINFADQRDRRNYLVYVAEWLASIKLPSDITKFNDFVKRHKKSHRIIVWRILSHGGMNRATCLVKSVDKRLNQRDIDDMDIEAQAGNEYTWWSILYSLILNFLDDGWMMTTNRWKLLKEWFKSLNISDKTQKVAGNLLLGLKSVGGNIMEAVKKLGAWVKKMVKDMLAYLPSGSEIIWWIAKHFMTVLAAMAAVVIGFLLAPLIAAAIAKLLFKKYDIQGADIIIEKMEEDKGIQAQAWTPGLADDFLEMLAVNFKLPVSKLSAAVGTLPKLASIGKAIEWFFEKGYTIIMCIVEYVTGKPLAYDEVERSILTFAEGVTTFKALVQSGDMAIALAPDTLTRDISLENEKRQVEHAMNATAAKKPIRPYFSQKMASSTLLYSNLHLELDRTKRAAKPRPVPVWLYIRGIAGVGKSTFTTKLMIDIWHQIRLLKNGMVPDRPWSYRDVFTINQDEQFYDNYAKEFFALCDDFMQTKDNDEMRKIALALIGMIASVPYSLKVATPEQKANCFFESRCIISTTNLTEQEIDQVPGIKSIDALKSRRTIACELVIKGGRPIFKLDAGYDCKILDQTKTWLEYEELVALTVKCLLEREKQLQTPYTPVAIPMGHKTEFHGGRISFTAQMKKGSMMSKEDERDWKEYKEYQKYGNNDTMPLSKEEFLRNQERRREIQQGMTDLNEKWARGIRERNESEKVKEGKGKEKEDTLMEEYNMFSNSCDQAVSQSIRDGKTAADAIGTGLIAGASGFSAEVEKCGSIERMKPLGAYPLKTQEATDEEATAYARQLEAENEEIYYQTPDFMAIVEEQGSLKDMPYNIMSKGHRNIVTEDGQVTKLRPSWVAYFMRISESKPIKHEMNYMWPVEVEANNGEKFLAVYIGDGKCTLVRTKEEWKNLTTCLDQKRMKGPYGYKITDERYTDLPKLFSWMPMWLLKRLVKVKPQYIIPPYSTKYVPDAAWSWQKVRDSWLNNLGVTEEEVRRYQELFEEPGVMPQTPREFDEFFTKVHQQKYDWLTIAAVIAGSAIFFAGLGLVCSLLMPHALYKEAQMYPGATTRTFKMKIHRANRGRNAKRLTNVKAAHKKAAREAQMKTRDYSPIYRKIDRNTEIVECIVTPKGWTREQVDRAEVLTSSFCLFIGGTKAIVPMHTMIALGPEGPAWDRWIRLIRHQNYIVNIDDLEIEELRGDVAIVTFPGLQAKQNIVRHFAEDVPSHGQIDHIDPFIEVPTFNVRSTNVWSNDVHSVKITGYETFETDIEFRNIPNYKGMCGTVYCNNTTGQIIAVHMAGDKHASTSNGVIILRSDVEKHSPEYKEIVDPVQAEMSAGPMKPGLQVLGISEAKNGSYIMADTNIRKSDFDMEGFPFPETDSKPAMLRPVNDISPATNAFEKIGQQYYFGKPKLVNTDLLEFVPKTFNRKNIRQLTPFEAIHGVPGLIPSLDKRTGVGYFYKKMGFTRRTLFYDKEGKPFVHPILYMSIMNKIERIKNKEIIVPVFEDTLKDELRDGERVRLGKTRLFTAGDLDYLVIQRMVLGALIQELEGDPVGSPCALGLNPHSVDWGQLFARLGGSGEILNKILAGDFNGYDISVKNEALDAFVKLCLLLTVGILDPYLVEWTIRGTFLGWHVYGRIWYLRPWGTNS